MSHKVQPMILLDLTGDDTTSDDTATESMLVVTRPPRASARTNKPLEKKIPDQKKRGKQSTTKLYVSEEKLKKYIEENDMSSRNNDHFIPVKSKNDNDVLSHGESTIFRLSIAKMLEAARSQKHVARTPLLQKQVASPHENPTFVTLASSCPVTKDWRGYLQVQLPNTPEYVNFSEFFVERGIMHTDATESTDLLRPKKKKKKNDDHYNTSYACVRVKKEPVVVVSSQTSMPTTGPTSPPTLTMSSICDTIAKLAKSGRYDLIPNIMKNACPEQTEEYIHTRTEDIRAMVKHSEVTSENVLVMLLQKCGS